MRLTYSKVGVNVRHIERAHSLIDQIVSTTPRLRKRALGRALNIRQHYAGFVDLNGGLALAIHVDGVGTKVLVAEMLRRYSTIGIDCVAMNVNDLICVGAEPIALVDYLALDRMDIRKVGQIMKGIRRGAQEADVAIVGGETAVMPDVINGFDLSAMCVGIVRKRRIVTGEELEEGDAIIGLRSSGIHSNGLTLARKVLFKGGFRQTIAEELLRPTRIYVKPILSLLRKNLDVHGLAHITGGAYAKLKRIGVRARLGFHLHNLFPPQAIFGAIQRVGKISDREMYRTFNMGAGFLVMCSDDKKADALRILEQYGVLSQVVGRVVSERKVVIEVGSRETEVESW